MSEKFDYEKKTWGANKVRLSPGYLSATKLKRTLKALEKTRGKVLDFGCGAGGFAKAIKFYRPELEVYGCDISKTAIFEAKEEAEGVNFEVSQEERTPYENRFFDAVVLTDVLEHVENPHQTLQEIRRIMKPKSLFFAYVPLEGTANSLHFWLRKFFGWRFKEIYGGHIQQYTYKNLKEIFEEENFKISEKKWSDQLLTQITDVTYFTLIGLRGGISSSVETYLAKNRRDFKTRLLTFCKATVAFVNNLEASLFGFLPGSGVYITSKINK